MTLRELNKLMADTYLVEDQQFLKLILAVVVSARLPTTPAWMMIVGPPGSGKTEFLNTIKDCQGITSISSMTSSTLVSGMKSGGVDPSLLMNIPVTGGILLFKDFTSILSLYADARTVIVSQLREIHDGSYHRRYGNGKVVNWKGQLGFLAAVTDTIYTSQDQIAAMGQRFLIFSPQLGGRYDVTMRALTNVTSGMANRRSEIAAAVKQYLDVEMNVLVTTYNKQGLPDPPQDFLEDVAQLAELATRARSAVKRDPYSKDHHITYAHIPEFPTRLAEQLTSLSVALMAINEHEQQAAGGPGEFLLLPEDKHLLFRIALDCIPAPRRAILRYLTMYFMASAYALASDMNYPYNTIKSWLEELNVLGVINATKHDNGKIDWWLKTEYRALLAKFENVADLGNEMPEPPKEEGVPLPTF